jgi:hypothetical protein
VAVVEATEDWETGYHFEIDPDFKDYGHIFPAKFIKSFARSNENVLEALRTTLKNRQRFWNINHCAESVDALLATNAVLTTTQGWGARLESATEKVFNAIFKQTNFANKLFDELHRQFGSAEWEHALVYGLEQLFPTYTIERVGGPSEKDHGTDILIKIPGILPDFHYAIAIQVKDRDGFVSEDVIEQINRADKYWEENESIKLIDKIVIITKADKEENMHLPNNDSGVKFIFSDDLKALLSEIGKRIIGGKMINQSDV